MRPEVGPAGLGFKWVVCRAASVAEFTVTVQQIRYTTNPPEQGEIEAFGEEIIGHPLPGHAIEPFIGIRGLLRPFVTGEVLGVNILTCKLYGDDSVEIVLKMPAGVVYTDATQQTGEGGGV
jgi:hypothetical protein